MIEPMPPTFDAAAAAWDTCLEEDLWAKLGPLLARPVPDFRRPPDRRRRAGRLALAARARPMAVTGILLSAAVAGPALAAAHGTLLPGIPVRSSATTGSLRVAKSIGENGQPSRLFRLVPKDGLAPAGVNSMGRPTAARPAHRSGGPSRLTQAAARAGSTDPTGRWARRPDQPPGTRARPSTASQAPAMPSGSKEKRQ